MMLVGWLPMLVLLFLLLLFALCPFHHITFAGSILTSQHTLLRMLWLCSFVCMYDSVCVCVLQVMYQETSYAVMGCLLIHDVCNPLAPAKASYALDNPFQLFEHGSFHGGVWRCGYKIGSIGEVSALSYYVAVHHVRALAFLATCTAVGRWVAVGHLP
jgi:hypothetical protein